MQSILTIATLSGILLSGLDLPVYAQESRTAPVMEIVREPIREGKGAAHEKAEADYAAIFRKANFPGHYVALKAISGPSEVWFLQPMASFEANQEYEQASEQEPLKSELAVAESRDGEMRASSRTIWAVVRPDMSYHPEKFDPIKTRYVMAGVFQVKLGRDADFLRAAKTYFDAFEKANVDQCTVAYQVVAGATSGTYLFFTPMLSMKALDESAARMQAVQQAMGADTFRAFMANTGDLMVSIDDTLLEVSPGMSYPPQRYIDADPDFWMPARRH